MKEKKKTEPSARSRIIACVGAGVILLMFGLNLLLTYVGMQKSLFVDMTYEELYTPSALMKETCDNILADKAKDTEVTAIFCNDPDRLEENVTSRVTYTMALKLQQKYPNFHVKTVNVTQNPTAVAAYKTTSLTEITSTDMILVCGTQYRIMPLENFWVSNSTTGEYYSYNGEYRLACALMSLLSVNGPTAYFVTGHGETVYDENDAAAAENTRPLRNLLTERGLRVATLDLSSVDAVPDDCVLLIVNNPRTDFTYDEGKLDSMTYRSELEKLDRYIVERQGAMIVAKDYKIHLPNFETYLCEWGFSFSDARVEDEEHAAGDRTRVLVEYDNSEDGYGSSIYGQLTKYSSAAATVISDTGYINSAFSDDDSRTEDGSDASRYYVPLFSSYATARAYVGESPATVAGTHTLAAVSARILLDSTTATRSYSYVCCSASGDFLSADLLGNASYANYDILSLLVENISRVDEYASSDLGGSSLNSSSSYGKVLVDTTMTETSDTVYAADGSVILRRTAVSAATKTWMTVMVVLVPLAVAVCGAAVAVRRRFR